MRRQVMSFRSARDLPTSPDQFSYPNMRAETTLPHPSSMSGLVPSAPMAVVPELQRVVQSPLTALIASPSPKQQVSLTDPTYQARQQTLNDISAFELRHALR